MNSLCKGAPEIDKNENFTVNFLFLFTLPNNVKEARIICNKRFFFKQKYFQKATVKIKIYIQK
jgi:hypothetical protein